jgi:energy-coupling factor transporter transmembrane protein EcfT
MRLTQIAVGPLSLLLCSVTPAAGAVAIHGAQVGALSVAVEAAAVGWLARDPRSFARRFAFGAIAAASIFVSTWLYGGRDLDEAAGAALRILYLVLPGAVLASRIRASELADHLAQRTRLPARVAVSSSVALLRIDGLASQWRQIRRARRARGLGFDGGPVRRLRAGAGAAFGLLVASLRQTAVLAVAMDARGFGHADSRTWAEAAPWLWADWLVVAIATGLAALPWLLR